MSLKAFRYNGKRMDRVPSILRRVANYLDGKEEVVTPKEQALTWAIIQCVEYAETADAGDALAEALNFLVQARDSNTGAAN